METSWRRRLSDADRRLYTLFHSRWRTPALDPVMISFTNAGTKGILWLAIAAGLFVESTRHGRWVAVLSVAALLVAEGVINMVLKPSVRRKRPYERAGLATLLVEPPGAHSWPSAHAGSSMAAACVLAHAYPLPGALLLLAAFLVGYSRIYVGVHYPADVVTGMLIGIGSAVAVLILAVPVGAVLHMPPVR